MFGYSLAPFACCLDAEWDSLISVHQILSLFHITPRVCHIKGHQNRYTPYDELDPISQMNVDADALATTEIREFGTIMDMVPFDPYCGVLLHIQGRTVTHDIERAIQDQLSRHR